jgi:AraC-like DNA-binding protein
VLLVADEAEAGLRPPTCACCPSAAARRRCWGGVGAGVLWLAEPAPSTACAPRCRGRCTRTPTPSPSRPCSPPPVRDRRRAPELLRRRASIDFALTLVDILFGATVQAQVKEMLCVDRVRGQEERQRVALQARFGVLQPKLTEAVTLMEANIEEPLSTDDIAQLAGVSRRQLERLFKQYLGSLPSRYYLELRLQRARQLLRDTNHSIVQVGLMCGFSSGSHFSTAFGALFGNTPREERQRKLAE